MVDLSTYMKNENKKDKGNTVLLMKFTPEKYVNDIITKGKFRFGSIWEYQHSSKKEVGDSLECVDTYINPKNNFTSTWGDPHKSQQGIDLTGQIDSILINNNPDITHLLSLYKIVIHKEFSIENITHKKFIDQRCLEFGNKCIIIWNVVEFRKRMLYQLLKQQIFSKWDPVDYIPNNSDILHLGKFSKRDTYQHQQEYRICLKNIEPVKEAFYIEIGNIADITYVCDTKNILDNHSLDTSIEDGIIQIELADRTLKIANLKKIKD